MILDSLKTFQHYTSLHRSFAIVLDFLKQTDLASLAPGRYPIEDDDIFAIVSENELRLPQNALLEAHDQYIDIQVIIRGKESFGWCDRTTCASPRGSMDPEKDILFFDDQPSTYFTLHEGELAVFFPADAHAPLVGEGQVKKCVIKARV